MRTVFNFTDFGVVGPYLGLMRASLLAEAPGLTVVELMADAPSFRPRSAAYLLAALIDFLPPDAVVLGVVDPGVGGARGTLVAEADGRWLVGPGNGLFSQALRRAATVRCFDIVWRPPRLSASFHGRDLFAPIAARLARGLSAEEAGCRPAPVPACDWPDDLAEIIYVDHYGNAMTGLRGDCVAEDWRPRLGGTALARAVTFSAVPEGEAFWYVNSLGLVEFAVNGGSARDRLGLEVGFQVPEIDRAAGSQKS